MAHIEKVSPERDAALVHVQSQDRRTVQDMFVTTAGLGRCGPATRNNEDVSASDCKGTLSERSDH
jgi:hypothetical protein